MHDLVLYALLGAGTAAVYAVLAQGIVIVHRGSGILNFAQGAYLMFGAFVFAAFRNDGLPVWAATAATTIVAGVTGAATYAFVVRPLRSASLVSRIVATLGVAIILTTFCDLIWSTGGVIEQVLPARTVHVLGVDVTVDRLIMLGLSAGLAAVLWAVYRFTTFGLATAAVSENRRGAAALGWSPDVIAVASWSVSAATAGIAAVAIAPVQPALTAPSFTLLVVPALAVALVAGFTSFPVAALAGFVLATAQQYLSGTVIASHSGLQDPAVVAAYLGVGEEEDVMGPAPVFLEGSS